MNEHAIAANGQAEAMPEERRLWIRGLVEQHGKVRIDDLATQAGVQPITIRRDLEVLAGEGMIIRVRGGAIRNDRVRLEFGYAERGDLNRHEKSAIASHAASMVQPGQTIILDTGTTTQLLARELVGRVDIQIVTNSMIVAYELRNALGVNVILLGGQARRGGFELIGPITERLLSDLHADFAFLGADAIDPGLGFFTTDLGVARVEELMIKAAATVVVLADASKLGRRAFARYAAFAPVHMLITSGRIDAGIRAKLAKQHTELVEVPSAAG
jgi:DeoR/GlpR family transcriptional regulator of sugar metabolism